MTIRTDGIGSVCVGHLNLTVTLAEAWGLKPEDWLPPRKLARRSSVRKARPKPARIRFAGYDPTERQVRSIVKAQGAIR